MFCVLFHPRTWIGYASFLGISFMGMSSIQAVPVDPRPDVVAQSTNPPPQWPGNRTGGATRGLSPSDWPGNRTGGGTRGCETLPGSPRTLSPLKRSFVALVPQTNLSLTTQAYPRLAWYIPPSSVSYAELAVLSEQDMLLYRATFRIDGEGGIYSLAIPADAAIPALEPDQAYRWTLSFYCQSNEQTLDPSFDFGLDLGRTSISSYIYRQSEAIDPSSSVEDSNWAAQVNESLEQNRWLDALDQLLSEYCKTPDSETFAEEWQNALKTIALEELADEPIRLHCADR